MKQTPKETLSFDFPSRAFNWSSAAKVIPIRKGNIFPELNQFREELDSQQSNFYELHQRHATVYRWVFLSMSLFFMFLLAVLYFQNVSGLLFVYYGNSMIIKKFLMIVAGFISISSIAIAYHIRTEREAVWHLVRHAKRELIHSYMTKSEKWGWQRFFPFFGAYDKAAMLRLSYHNSLDKIKEVRGNSLVLVDKIAGSKNVESQEKIVLFNQAIQELREKLQMVVNSF